MRDDTLEVLVEQLQSLDRDLQVSHCPPSSCFPSRIVSCGMAMETLDDYETAAGWLSNPGCTLCSEIPLVLVGTGKREDVINCLGQIQHGIFA